jgi:mono/diheme cytochrome c family protein
MKRYKATSVFFLLFIFIANATLGQVPWKVPEVKKLKTANFKFTKEVATNGETIFKANCSACHGVPGKASFALMTPSPGDPATDKFQLQTDGELFYKITNGRTPMPAFKNILSDKDRWTVISYIRSFNAKYIQPDTVPAKGLIDYILEMTVTKLNDSSNKVKVAAIAYTIEDPTPVKVVGADVTLFAERYFGMLPVDKKKTTDQNGEAIFTFPKDLPGDTAGNVNLTVSLIDEVGSFGEGETKARLKVGMPFTPISLIDTRAMWSVRGNAPLWVLLTYCGAVLLVFGFVFYILSQLLKMRKMGIKSDKS